MILSAVLHRWLAVVMHFEPIFSVFQRDKRDKCIYIICVIIYDAFTCELPFCIGEYFPGNVILFVCNVLCLPVLVFGLAVCISGLFFLISCSKFISHFVESCLIFLFAPLLFIRNVKPYFSEGVVFCLVFFLLCLPSCRTAFWVLLATLFF